YSYLPKDYKSTVLATRTPGPGLAYTLGVARRHKQLLAGDQTQQTCRPRVPDQQSRIKFAQVRKASPEPAAQTPAKLRYTLGIARRKSQLLTSRFRKQTPSSQPKNQHRTNKP
ncbi:hypothetical protein NQ315_013550, partial [Exocentrus adspersus]